VWNDNVTVVLNGEEVKGTGEWNVESGWTGRILMRKIG
jgi:hypothetical protein